MSLKTFLEEKIPYSWKSYYKSGRLDRAIACLSDCKVVPSDHLKSGSTCVVFNHGPHEVIKLCTRKISYYSYFTDDLKSFIDTRFSGYFLPINRMIHDDGYFFIYTQSKIQVLDFSEVNQDVFIYVLRLIANMITQNAFTPDLISSNFGWVAETGQPRKLYMLDYHDLKTADRYIKKKSWSKVIRCLMEFATLMNHGKPFEAQFGESWMPWKDDGYIKSQDYGSKYFGSDLSDLFKTFYGGNKDQINRRIESYIAKLLKR